MAELLVKNSLNQKLSVKFNVSVKQFTVKGEQGDAKWLLEVATTYLDKDGYNIRPKLVHLRTLDSLSEEIELAVEEMCALIDWGILESDGRAPFVFEHSPTGADVPMSSYIEIILRELFPSSGIDISEMKIMLDNGTAAFDITNELEITGDPYEYKINWRPALIVHDHYGD